MNYSIENYLKNVIPYLNDELVSPAALSDIQKLSRILPPLSIAGFECRLREGDSRVDFQVCIPCFEPKLSESLSNYPEWIFIKNLCHEWVEKNNFIHQFLKFIILEFDVTEELSKIPVPCIFLSFDNKFAVDLINHKTIGADKLIDLSSRLLNRQISPILQSNLQLCVDSLPKDAYISHLGAMLSRPIDAVRINAKKIPIEQIPDYLAKIGWVESTDKFALLLCELSKFCDYIMLSFDVGESIYPKIGLECFLDKQPQENEPRWELFLDFLVRNQLCTSAKRDALLTWSGLSQKHNSPEFWPDNISLVDRLLAKKAASVFSRWINHIKLVYQPGCLLEAKGYLGFSHYWMDNSKEQDKAVEKLNS